MQQTSSVSRTLLVISAGLLHWRKPGTNPFLTLGRLSTTLGHSSPDNLSHNPLLMAIRDLSSSLRAAVAVQGEKVKMMKKSGGDGLKTEVEMLLELKKQLAALELKQEACRPSYTRCRQQLENLCKRRSVFFPAFEIYGGTAGLFDWGPPGCAVKAEVESFWRRHFVLEEDMLEISGTCLTPHNVLKTSGHVERFCDFMTTDITTGQCFRADKLLEDFIDSRLADKNAPALSNEERDHLELIRRQADSYSATEISQLFKTLNIKSPTGADLTDPFPFNLMFKTKIGPKESADVAHGDAYLRPETAQGILVNFRRLLEFNAGKIPFAAAQLGLGFRNEIAPRNGLLRVREFQMAEIEHFIDPLDKSHSKFAAVADMTLPLFSQERQLTDGELDTQLSVGEAVKKGVINNETLGYFMARTYLFLTSCGIQPCGLRFRQHLKTEMAHYASDCWATKIPLLASRRLAEPKELEVMKMIPNRALLGPAFKKEQSLVLEILEQKSDEAKKEIEECLETSGSYTLKSPTGVEFHLTRELIKFQVVKQKITEETFVPAVIEPSFGIGRIIYCILEHTFRSRGIKDQEERCFLALPISITPIKCSLLSISSNSVFDPLLLQVKTEMTRMGIPCKLDQSSASIGKRYARTDEIGIPFGVTVDFQSVQDQTVTLRERDSMKQIRVKVGDVCCILTDLIHQRMAWIEALGKYPLFVEQDVTAD